MGASACDGPKRSNRTYASYRIQRGLTHKCNESHESHKSHRCALGKRLRLVGKLLLNRSRLHADTPIRRFTHTRSSELLELLELLR